MKDLPIIFPIALVVLLVLVFFTGAYAISEGATTSEPLNTQYPPATAGTIEHANTISGFGWYEDAAIWVCPLH
jgi:hypothetical protein